MFKMKVITWNIRGLNNPRKQRNLKNRLEDGTTRYMLHSRDQMQYGHNGNNK
jgi:hypothetical protein